MHMHPSVDYADLAGRLAGWITEQVRSRCGGALFGLSGGIDSAVVAVLCKKALPGSVLAVLMPCHSSPDDIRDARLLAETFDIPTLTVPLDDAYDTLLQAVPAIESTPELRRTAEANLKPRLRMATLYYLANRLGYLVVGTSNRSEISIGYTTKYGDSGADILPLGNLRKTQVRGLAEYLGIPRPIIDKAPSAGLWRDQTDEGEMGFTYQELDDYLATGEAPEDVRKKIEARAAATEHKRKPAPVPPF